MAFSALPVLTDPNVRSAPVLETTTISLAGAKFETVSEALNDGPITCPETGV
jgi:hypothetical protein